jgi:hypothetical protein
MELLACVETAIVVAITIQIPRLPSAIEGEAVARLAWSGLGDQWSTQHIDG